MGHRHHRTLGVGVEILKSEHQEMGECRRQVGITDNYAQGIADVGYRLQLAQRRL